MAKTILPSTLRRLLPLSLLASASLAQAGHWVPTYQGGFGTPPAQGLPPVATPVPYTLYNGSYGGGGRIASGTITATLTWTPDSPSDFSEPPAFVYVLETCSAGGQSDNSGASSPVSFADNGFGKGPAPVVPHPVFNGYVQYTANSVGTRVTYKAVAGKTVQVTASPEARGGMSAAVSYRASVTNYAVTISSDRDESFHKGASGPESNFTEVLTPRFGDTVLNELVVSGPSGDPHRDDYYRINPTFTRELIGAWINPYHEWNLDGTTFTDSLISEWESVSKEWRYTPQEFANLSGKTGGESKEVTLKVTDDGGSGVSANAAYTLRIHHPYENWQTVGNFADQPEEPIDLSPEQPGVAYQNGSIHCTWNNPGPFWGLAAQYGSIYAASVKSPLWSLFFATATVGLNDLGPKPDGGSANFNDCWGDSDSTIASGNWGSSKSLYQMAPRLYIYFRVKKRMADAYGVNGYTGPTYMGVSEVLPYRKKWAGDFTLLQGNTGGGS